MAEKRTQTIDVDIKKAFAGSKIEIPYLNELKLFMSKNPKEAYAVSPFVGGNSSVAVVRFKRKKAEHLMTMINPVILSTQGFIVSEETQFGVEGVYLVPRHPQMEVMFVCLPKGVATKQKLLGKSALMMQQALHVMAGVYIDDIGLRIDNNKEYQKASQERKNEIIHEYIQALKEVEEEAIESDPKIKEYVQATKFLGEQLETSVEIEKAVMNIGQADASVSKDRTDGGESEVPSEGD